ncbi:hypothetical protein D3C86_2017950 [compost metagenome]
MPLARHREQVNGTGVVMARQAHARLEDDAQCPDTQVRVQVQRLYIDAREVRRHGVLVNREFVCVDRQQFFVIEERRRHRHCYYPHAGGYG